MAKQDFTAGQVLTAAQMDSLQANDYNWTTSAQTASYVLTAANAGQTVTMTNAGATTITVNTGIFSAGDTVKIINLGAGTTTITAGTATVNAAASLALPQYASGTLWFSSASAAIFIPDDRTPRILQLLSTAKTDTFSSTSIPYVDITGLSVSITPSSTTSKIFVMAVVEMGVTTGGVDPFLRLVRGSTAIDVGDAAGSRTQASAGGRSSGVADVQSNVMMFLDSPATTSATTYKVQLASNTGVVVYVNRSSDDGNIAERGRYASSITVMEVSA